MFPGKKLTDEGSQDGDGQTYRPSLELDLDSGVVRLSRPTAPRTAQDEPGDH